jgi:hypothetical protein
MEAIVFLHHGGSITVFTSDLFVGKIQDKRIFHHPVVLKKDNGDAIYSKKSIQTSE